ncbi:MAG: HAD family phosphatase [Clostridia bacterium]|nr:HAD family phosphatase [Clostridia bacterium]
MRYKLIAVDMDGTLLDSRKKITEATAQAVKLAGEKGAVFCLSTGRPLMAVTSFLEQLELTTPTITYNGAKIIEPRTGKTLYEQGLEQSAVIEIYELGKRLGATMCAWSKEELWVSEINEHVERYREISGAVPKVIDDVSVLAKRGVTKFIWCDEPERISQFARTAPRELSEGINCATSSANLLEIYDGRVSKAAAMEFLGAYLGIEREQMIAIGDGYNDLPMLQYAGLGVAMANAAEDIKAQCGYVTVSNDEDGVAQVLYRFVIDVDD